MRVLAILMVVASLPLFMALLRSPAMRPWVFTSFGALPFLSVTLNLDAAFMNWPLWPGHTKGLSVTLLDTLSLSVCMRYAPRSKRPPLLAVPLIFVTSLLPGLLVSNVFQPSIFFVAQGARVVVVFYATYLLVSNGHLLKVATGLAIAVLLAAGIAARDALSGISQAPGILGHQNLSGMAVNLCVPILLALGLQRKGNLYLLAAAAGGLGAVVGGSRASILLYGVAVIATLIGSGAMSATPRKMGVAVAAMLSLAAASPFAIQKLSERSQGGQIELAKDGERIAFERAASMMIEDYPWGVGLNQYVNVANVGGYMSRAGVRWGVGARSTSVHNTYLLVRAEGGLIALVGLLCWLVVPLGAALRNAFRRKVQLREVNWASAVALLVVSVHGAYEWVLVTAVPQYLIAIVSGIVAASMARHVKREQTTQDRTQLVQAQRAARGPQPMA